MKKPLETCIHELLLCDNSEVCFYLKIQQACFSCEGQQLNAVY